MKTKILSILIVTTTLAHAHLIDLTPGGFDFGDPPPSVDPFLNGPIGFQLIAGANIRNGIPVWSPFTLFGENNFSITMNAALTGAVIGWNFNTISPYFGTYVFVESFGLDHLYRISNFERFGGDGSVTIDGITQPIGITFFGKTSVPDSGSTLMLFGAAAAVLILLRNKNVLQARRGELRMGDTT